MSQIFFFLSDEGSSGNGNNIGYIVDVKLRAISLATTVGLVVPGYLILPT